MFLNQKNLFAINFLMQNKKKKSLLSIHKIKCEYYSATYDGEIIRTVKIMHDKHVKQKEKSLLGKHLEYNKHTAKNNIIYKCLILKTTTISLNI